jgi:hypothetical protein
MLGHHEGEQAMAFTDGLGRLDAGLLFLAYQRHVREGL